MTGCLLPQPDCCLTPPARVRNQPPQVNADLTDPPPPTWTQGPGDCHKTFKVFVTDPDANDFIHVRWFVDFNQNPSQSGFDGITVGQSEFELPFDLTTSSTSTYDLLLRNGTRHIVEALVTDCREGFNGHAMAVTNRVEGDVDGGVAPDPNYLVAVTWFVTVDSAKAQCP